MGAVGRDVFEIASLFIGVAFAALLIGHSGDTATVVKAVGGTFDSLLNTVELANQGPNISSAFNAQPINFG